VLHQAPSHKEVWGREGSGADSKHQHHKDVTGQHHVPSSVGSGSSLAIIAKGVQGKLFAHAHHPAYSPIITLTELLRRFHYCHQLY